MDQDTVINLVMQAITVAAKVALPILLAGLVVGLMVSIFQAVTQIQEMTLTFIPKILATVVVMVVAGPWMLNQIVTYTQQLWQGIPGVVS
jgi:flagellar biosynthesis protein FliQ